MKALGTNEPWVFHAYILIYSIVGFYFLYLLSEKICGSKTKAALVVLFAMTSPIYTFYQGGFLPTIPNISNTIIALYCYALYFEGGRKKWFRWALFFFTFAALSRLTFVIPFLAVLGFELIRIIQRKAKFWSNILGVALSALLIAAAQYYNSTLRAKYGSDFLSELLPAENKAELKKILEHMWEAMVFSYLSLKHYFLLFLLTVLVLIAMVIKERNTYKTYKVWWVIVFFWFIGVTLFFFVMAKQFFAHDYYFLDTFYLPIVLTVALCLAILPKPKWYFGDLVLKLFVIYFGIVSFKSSTAFQKERCIYVADDHFTGSVINFEGADSFLTHSGVDRQDTILVIHSSGPNIPFIQMNRVGLVVVGHEPADIIRSLSWKWDYVVFQKPYFVDEVYNIYPDILKKVALVAVNENLILCKRKMDTIPQTLTHFVGNKKAYAIIREDFEKEKTGQKNILLEKDPVNGNNRVGLINSQEVYGFAQDLTKYVSSDTKGRVLDVKGKFLSKNENQISLVFSYYNGDDLVYYQAIELNTKIPTQTWTEKEFRLFLPRRASADETLRFYIYNPNRNELMIDDLHFSFSRK